MGYHCFPWLFEILVSFVDAWLIRLWQIAPQHRDHQPVGPRIGALFHKYWWYIIDSIISDSHISNAVKWLLSLYASGVLRVPFSIWTIANSPMWIRSYGLSLNLNCIHFHLSHIHTCCMQKTVPYRQQQLCDVGAEVELDWNLLDWECEKGDGGSETEDGRRSTDAWSGDEQRQRRQKASINEARRTNRRLFIAHIVYSYMFYVYRKATCGMTE